MSLKKASLSIMALMAAAVFSSCSSTGAGNQAAGGQTQVDKSLIGSGGAEGATDFFVESVSPNEEVPSSVSFPSIQVQFSNHLYMQQLLDFQNLILLQKHYHQF